MKNNFLLALTVAISLTACKKNPGSQDAKGYTKGSTITIGNGKAWSWIQTGKENKPLAVGVTLTTSALQNLPHAFNESGAQDNMFVLKLPKLKSTTVFDHVGLDWNPRGRELGSVYDKALFDFKFYMVSENERSEINSYGTDSIKKVKPEPAYLPSSYIMGSGAESKMDVHWVDVTSPELDPVNHSAFTQTFIYGSNNGKVTFYEPMITLAFLKNTSGFQRNIPQPAKFARSGYYPTKMHIQKYNDEIHIIMDGFIYRRQA